jgi:hypothetical protein
VWKQPGFPIKEKKTNKKQRSFLYCYCKMEFLQEKSMCANEIRAKDEILHAEEGGRWGVRASDNDGSDYEGY